MKILSCSLNSNRSNKKFPWNPRKLTLDINFCAVFKCFRGESVFTSHIHIYKIYVFAPIWESILSLCVCTAEYPESESPLRQNLTQINVHIISYDKICFPPPRSQWCANMKHTTSSSTFPSPFLMLYCFPAGISMALQPLALTNHSTHHQKRTHPGKE